MNISQTPVRRCFAGVFTDWLSKHLYSVRPIFLKKGKAAMRFLPLKDDPIYSRHGNVLLYDKLEHAVLAFIGVMLMAVFSPSVFQTPSPITAFFTASISGQVMFVRLLGIAKEIWDAFIPYDKSRGYVQGWSWVDLLANELGMWAAVQTLILTGEVLL